MKIITRWKETLEYEKVGHMDVSDTQFERVVPCYIVKLRPHMYRYIPMEDVIEIIDNDVNHFVKVED